MNRRKQTGSNSGQTSPSQIAASSGLTRGAVSKLIERLLKKGLVSRAEANNDRRFQDVNLTAAGRALVPKLAGAGGPERRRVLFSHFSEGARGARDNSQKTCRNQQAQETSNSLKEITP